MSKQERDSWNLSEWLDIAPAADASAEDAEEEDAGDWTNPTADEQAALLDVFREMARRLRPDLAPPPVARYEAGRNDPCPCGSGKKFKRCHGENAAG